jgi:hypothetical protein
MTAPPLAASVTLSELGEAECSEIRCARPAQENCAESGLWIVESVNRVHGSHPSRHPCHPCRQASRDGWALEVSLPARLNGLCASELPCRQAIRDGSAIRHPCRQASHGLRWRKSPCRQGDIIGRQSDRACGQASLVTTPIELPCRQARVIDRYVIGLAGKPSPELRSTFFIFRATGSTPAVDQAWQAQATPARRCPWFER